MQETFVEATLLARPGLRIPVSAQFSYYRGDPYAVHVTFHPGTERAVRWTFARDLLVEGLFTPRGQGDVRVWPGRTDGVRKIMIKIKSLGEVAIVEAPAAPVADWLVETLRSVPAGTETDWLQMDEQLVRFGSQYPADSVWLRGVRPTDESGSPEAI
ncbi:SsgA family sporulation/cell division regulator [Streptomyces sp. NPDC057686]|uniref:SsgA family sporulation/cell division regulator n=1 Tax=Streptomyces sp. NPDC057686 TaxID=3346212 RepID=UPI00369FEC48